MDTSQLTYRGVTLVASVHMHEDGSADLLWTDGVANEHVETYDTLPVAVVRLATLIHCDVPDTDRSLRQDAAHFTTIAEFLLHTTVQD